MAIRKESLEKIFDVNVSRWKLVLVGLKKISSLHADISKRI
jgi:hypothetical protein